MWPNFKFSELWHEITKIIYRNGPNGKVSIFRPVTMTNKVTILQYMKSNIYYSLRIGKSLINNLISTWTV